ncbi:MAG TPA: lipoyl synthase [Thermoanaerobaculia bacterium]|nr:lipoyl synthase [Thermoanaerobaculia bacterium]
MNKRAGQRPPWLRIRLPGDLDRLPVTRLMRELDLNTVCQEARCPNIYECWSAGTATFMILGEVCTRRCTFCAVGKGTPLAPDPSEPGRVAEAVERMGVRHCVITTVNRDDLPDGGAEHFARTIEAVRRRTGATVEVLISDLQGDREALRTILAARPDVLAHNVETIPRLYLQVRPGSRYRRSLEVLRRAHEERFEGMYTKSSVMLGLGESDDEILGVARDLREAGVDVFTIGQYLAPAERNHPVRKYYTPEEFDRLGLAARRLGFHHVESGPLVRSSYMAHRAVESCAEAVHAEGHLR